MRRRQVNNQAHISTRFRTHTFIIPIRCSLNCMDTQKNKDRTHFFCNFCIFQARIWSACTPMYTMRRRLSKLENLKTQKIPRKKKEKKKVRKDGSRWLGNSLHGDGWGVLLQYSYGWKYMVWFFFSLDPARAREKQIFVRSKPVSTIFWNHFESLKVEQKTTSM